MQDANSRAAQAENRVTDRFIPVSPVSGENFASDKEKAINYQEIMTLDPMKASQCIEVSLLPERPSIDSRASSGLTSQTGPHPKKKGEAIFNLESRSLNISIPMVSSGSDEL